MNLLTWLTAQAAGLGLETDMSPKQAGSVDDDVSPNASLTVAPYGVPTHPANEAYAKCMAAVLMKTIGMNLSSITNSENFAWAAIQIADYFSDDFGDQFETPATSNLPKFLLPPEERVSPVIVPAAFRYRLGQLELSTPDQACSIVRNLDWLTSAQYETLAGQLDFVTIQKAIQRCCMERSQRNLTITQLAVMQALYAAVP